MSGAQTVVPKSGADGSQTIVVNTKSEGGCCDSAASEMEAAKKTELENQEAEKKVEAKEEKTKEAGEQKNAETKVKAKMAV